MVRLDILKETFSRFPFNNYSSMHSCRCSKRFIEYLFSHYQLVEMCTDWYDEEEVDEEIRLRECTWQDPIGPGIWELTQERAQQIAKECMMRIRNQKIYKKNRFWFGSNEEYIICYWYERDLPRKYDLAWIFKRRIND